MRPLDQVNARFPGFTKMQAAGTGTRTPCRLPRPGSQAERLRRKPLSRLWAWRPNRLGIGKTRTKSKTGLLSIWPEYPGVKAKPEGQRP